MSTETPWPTPQTPAARNPVRDVGRRLRTSGDVTSFATVALLGVAAGLVVGALWRALAPAVQAVFYNGAYGYVAPEGKSFIGQDGWFAVLATAAAVLLALFAFLRYRTGPSTGAALGLAVGSLGGARLAAWFGGYLGPGHGSITRAAAGVANGATFDLPIQLRATGTVWLWPLIAFALFYILMLIFGPVDIGPEEPGEPGGPFPGWADEASGAAPQSADGPAGAGPSDATANPGPPTL